METENRKILNLLTEREKKILFWDYYPEKLSYLKILQRIADFFPHHGRKAEIIRALYRERENLRLDKNTEAVIKLYYEVLMDIEREKNENN